MISYMVRDTDEKLNRAENDLFDEDNDDSREIRGSTVKIVALFIVFALILAGIVLGWHLYGDVILAGIDRLMELLSKVQNPTGFR